MDPNLYSVIKEVEALHQPMEKYVLHQVMMPSSVNIINLSSNIQRNIAITLQTVSRSFLCPDFVNVFNFQSRQRRHLPLKLLLGSFFYPLSHFFCMLFASLPFFQPLFLQTVTHSTVHVVTCAKELHDVVLFVALF